MHVHLYDGARELPRSRPGRLYVASRGQPHGSQRGLWLGAEWRGAGGRLPWPEPTGEWGCFELFSRVALTAFAIVMPRPSRPPDIEPDRLPHQHIFLLQRINALARERREQAVLIYDGQGMNIQGRNLSACISNYIFRVAMPNEQMGHILDTAFFVDSRVTPGIQVSDLAAGALRLREQHRLDGADGAFNSAIRRFAGVVARSTRSDLVHDDGIPLHGIMRLREGGTTRDVSVAWSERKSSKCHTYCRGKGLKSNSTTPERHKESGTS